MFSIRAWDVNTNTAISPERLPAEGEWAEYSSPTHTQVRQYFAPVTPVEIGIRMITTRAFMQRLSQSERIALRASTNDIVVDMLDDIRMASYIDLDNAALAAGLGYLDSLGLIATAQVTDMVLDGTELEAYRGVL